jgi:hypothetical protein
MSTWNTASAPSSAALSSPHSPLSAMSYEQQMQMFAKMKQDTRDNRVKRVRENFPTCQALFHAFAITILSGTAIGVQIYLMAELKKPGLYEGFWGGAAGLLHVLVVLGLINIKSAQWCKFAIFSSFMCSLVFLGAFVVTRIIRDQYFATQFEYVVDTSSWTVWTMRGVGIVGTVSNFVFSVLLHFSVKANQSQTNPAATTTSTGNLPPTTPSAPASNNNTANSNSNRSNTSTATSNNSSGLESGGSIPRSQHSSFPPMYPDLDSGVKR